MTVIDWKSLPKGTIVQISDEQAIEESMREGHGIHPQDYELVGCLYIQAKTPDFKSHLPIKWNIVTLKDVEEDNDVTLIYKIVTDEYGEDIVDIGVYYSPIEPGDRASFIDRDIKWLFDPPEKDYGWAPGELSYSTYPSVPDVTEDDKDIQVLFQMNTAGLMFGVYREDNKDYPCLIAEYYDIHGKTQNPRMLLLEQAYLDPEGEIKSNGGWVNLYLGCSVRPTEIEVLT